MRHRRGLVVRLLFVHQAFPGQYIHILRELHSRGGHQLIGLGIEETAEVLPESVHYFRYNLQRGNQPGLHPWAMDMETKVIRGEACAKAANELKKQGFVPDLICGHPGWGELLFLKDVWPETPLLTYQEFFYNPRGFDYDFDPELQGTPTWDQCANIRMKTANQLLNLESSNWCVTPTEFQKRSYPASKQTNITVIHDGIDTEKAKPIDKPSDLTLPNGIVLKHQEKIITFVNRNLEPYRGCHSMIRSIPRIQELEKEAKIIIVGNTSGVSYGSACPEGEWPETFLKEIEGKYDPSQVIFTGQLPYEKFIPLLQMSNAHVYLTYPFVLSWSLLEAMSCGCAIVGSDTEPVREVIRHRYNGLLVDFFKPDEIAESIAELIKNQILAKELGNNARATVIRRFRLQECVQRQLALMDLVASRAIGYD